MFSLIPLSALALAASVVSGLAIPRAPGAPSTWSSSLEDYTTYHNRYLAINCQSQHNTPFFDRCCHPLQKGSQPNPSCTASNNADDHDEDCEDDDTEDDDTTVAPPPAPKPTPATTPAPKPAPVTTPAPKPTPASPAPGNNVSSAKGLISGGFATFFYQNGVAGACGKVHGDGEFIAAMDSRRYGNTSVRSSLCGKRVRITNPKNGKSVTVTVADACPTCENSNSIDLSVGAFKQIASLEQGLVPIQWQFV